MTNTRIQLLEEFLRNPIDYKDILFKLSGFEWDSDELVVLQKKHLKNVLNLFLKKQIDISVLEEWTNTIEGRDDINYEKYMDIIDELANPMLYEKFSKKRIKDILENLE